MKEKIESLIKEAEEHSFQKNSYTEPALGTFSRAGVEMQSWVAECEDFILNNYGNDSAYWRIFERFDIRHLNGYYEHEFELGKAFGSKQKYLEALTELEKELYKVA